MASWEVCIDSMGHSIRVAEGRGGGWLHGRYALTPWDAASELLKVEGEGGFMGGICIDSMGHGIQPLWTGFSPLGQNNITIKSARLCTI